VVIVIVAVVVVTVAIVTMAIRAVVVATGAAIAMIADEAAAEGDDGRKKHGDKQ